MPGGGSLTVAPSDATALALWSKAGPAANPQQLNRYSYVLNNPLKSTDPTGHCAGIIALVCAVGVAAYILLAGGTVAVNSSSQLGSANQGAGLTNDIQASTAVLASNITAVTDIMSGIGSTILQVGEAVVKGPLSLQVKGEYVPPGLNGRERNAYREAIHRYKRAYGLPADFKVPRDILDQIADAIKDGENSYDAADNADAPPEGEQQDPPPQKGKDSK